MTTTTTRSAAPRVPCPHCGYTAEPGSSIAGHIAMAHAVPVAEGQVALELPDPENTPAAPADSPQVGAAPSKPKRSRAAAGETADPEPKTPVVSAPAGASAANPVVATAPGGTLRDIPLAAIDVGDNVRVELEGLEELAASIAEHGVLQPIKVTGPLLDRYQVVWGQRRTLAARMAGLASIPAIVLPAESEIRVHGATRSIEQLVENLHRADLPAMDRARAIREVVDAGTSQADLARKLGVDPSMVSNSLRLLELDKGVQGRIAKGELSATHGRALVGLAPKTQREIAAEVVERGMSAHQVEAEIQRRKRQDELEGERRKADAAELEKKRIAVDEVIAAQTAKIPLDIVVVVEARSYYGNGNDSTAWLVDRLKAGGFAGARKANGWQETEPRPGGGVCTCKAFRARVTESVRYEGNRGRVTTYGLKWETACLEPKHRQAKVAASEHKRLEKEAVSRRVVEHVKRTSSAWALPEARAIAMDRVLAEAMLWDVLGYRLPDWAEKRGGKRTNPWASIRALTDAQLADILGQELAGDFRDKAGYHVDWPAVAEDLGLTPTGERVPVEAAS